MTYINTQVWGDLHCQWSAYKYREARIGSVQLGDFCLNSYKDMTFKKLNKRFGIQYGPRFFIDGNHDHFPELNCNADEPCCVNEQGTLFHIPRGYVSGKTMFIGGAESIDKQWRTPGRDLWPEESLSQTQFEKIREMDVDVEVILSHECPQFVRRDFFGITENDSTALALELIFNHFQPKLWVFAHHHRLGEDILRECKFVCLPSGYHAFFDLPLGSLFENV